MLLALVHPHAGLTPTVRRELWWLRRPTNLEWLATDGANRSPDRKRGLAAIRSRIGLGTGLAVAPAATELGRRLLFGINFGGDTGGCMQHPPNAVRGGLKIPFLLQRRIFARTFR